MRWFEIDASGRVLASVQNIETSSPSWTFGRDLPAARQMQWQAEALGGPSGACHGQIGSSGGAFSTPGFVPAAPPPPPLGGGGYLGVQLRTMGPPLRDPERVVIIDVLAHGPAVFAGLRPDDVVLEVDGTLVQRAEDVVARVSAHAPGDRVTLTIERDGERRVVRVVVGARP